MTITQLKALIPAYLGESGTDLTSVGGVDLILMALNNARIQAEMAHDFVEQNKVVRLAVTTTGTAISGAVLESDGATVTAIKTIQRCYLRDVSTSPTTY